MVFSLTVILLAGKSSALFFAKAEDLRFLMVLALLSGNALTREKEDFLAY
ncbi:MAG: hypothetical protein ACI97A_002431 [Planctomycetota bacterium]|jgi:hypothetical protein